MEKALLNTPGKEDRCFEIERTRLLDSVLPWFQSGKILLVTAGPGSGKTSFAQQLLNNSDARTTVVNLKRISTDIDSLVHRLEGMFTQLWPDHFREVIPCHAVPVADRASLQANIDFFLDELFLCGDTPAIIVFDGCEVLTERPLWAELISRLLQRFPSFISIIFLSTVSLRFSPLPKLRSQGKLQELTTGELYFDAAESQQFLLQNAPGLSKENIRQAMSKVGGWPAGLSLLCLEAKNRQQCSFHENELPESLHDYLQHEVLSGITSAELALLCTAALLQPFTMELLGEFVSMSGQDIADIFSSYSFVFDQIDLDSQRKGAQFSHVFSQFFSCRAKMLLGEQKIRKIHKKAARLFKKHQQADRALIHLVALKNWPSVMSILLAGNKQWSRLEDYEKLLFWIDRIPATYVKEHPLLSILLGKAHFYLGKLDSAWENFTVAHDNTRSGSKNWLESGCRLCEVLLLKGYLEEGVSLAEKLVSRARFISRHRAEAMMFQAIGLHLLSRFEECDRLWQHINTVASSRFLPLDRAARCYLKAPKAIFYNLERGEFEESERILDLAIAVFRHKDPRKRLGWVLLFKGVLKMELQQKKEAVTWFREAVEVSGNTNRSVHAGCSAFLAFVLAETGEIEEAALWLERAREIVARDLTLWAPVLCALTRAIITEQADTALNELNLAWNLASQRKMLLPLSLTALTAFRVRKKIGYNGKALQLCSKAAEICEQSNILHRQAHLLLCEHRIHQESGSMSDPDIFCKAVTIIAQKKLGFLLVKNQDIDGLGLSIQAVQKGISFEYYLQLCTAWGSKAFAALVPVFQAASPGLKMKIAALWGQKNYRGALPHIKNALKKTKKKKDIIDYRQFVQQMEKFPPEALHISLFGTFSLIKGERKLPDTVWKRRKSKELFKLFCLYPNTTFTQDSLMEVFWPESSPEKAKVNLWSVVSALKAALEPELSARAKSNYLDYNRQSYTLKLPAGSTIDTVLFENEVNKALLYRKSGDNARAIICCNNAEEFYTDEVLSENLYAPWSEKKREQLKLLFTQLLKTKSAIFFEQREFDKCIELYGRIVDIDLWDEESYLRLMKCHVLLGNDLRAVQVFRNCEDVLQKELNVVPGQKLQDLLQRILKRRPTVA